MERMCGSVSEGSTCIRNTCIRNTCIYTCIHARIHAYTHTYVVGRGGALVESMTFNRRDVGSTSALAPRRDLGQVHYLQLPVRFGVKLRNSMRAIVGSASE